MNDYPSSSSQFTRTLTLVGTLLGIIASLVTLAHFLGWLGPSGSQPGQPSQPGSHGEVHEGTDVPPELLEASKRGGQEGFTDIDWPDKEDRNHSPD